MPIIFIVVTILSNIYISINLLNKHIRNDILLAEEYELSLQKQHIKNQIDSMYNYIEHKKTESLVRLKQKLKNRVFMAYEIVEKIYREKNGLVSSEQLQKEILETLSKIRYGSDGYYFVAHIKNEKEIIAKMLPSTPNMEGINTFDSKDEDNNYYVQNFAKTVTQNENHEGFVTYKWLKLTKNQQFKKISFVKLFVPYNWFIGYGEYFDDFESDIKKEALQRLNLYKYENNGYIFTHNTNHILLQHPYRKNEIGTNDTNLTDKMGTKIIQAFATEALTHKDGTYIEYFWNKPNELESTKKIGYVRLIPEWNWVIGTGVYLEDINSSLLEIRKIKEDEVSKSIFKLLLISFVILLACILISLFISKKVNSIFYKYQFNIKEKQNELKLANNNLEEKVEEKTKELKILNDELEHKIHQRLLEIKDKDKQLLDQSKMVALGEMIGNIAHQWRQPLSVITVSASGIKLKKELNILEDDELMQFVDGIMNSSKYLSQVIDDFRNYIKYDKLKENFDINEAIRKSLSIIDSSLINNKLRLITNLEENINISNYQNELIQAFLNIVSNAKDALVEKVDNEDDRLIFIDTYTTQTKVIISIKDTAGGISEDILPKIFEPYFTTKDNNQGTGLGLFMTYKIIIDSMKGDLIVENKEINFNNKLYSGVEFKIILELF
jgi:signal transduction histidine kinase